MLTTAVFLVMLYYFTVISPAGNTLMLFLVLFLLATFAAVIISKLSTDPLIEHVTNLQNLSTETLHELNLPITTIKTNIHMLKKRLSDEKDVKRAQRIESACDMLAQRYDELDYMIKLQSSSVNEEEFDLAELVMQRVEFLSRIYPHVDFETDMSSTPVYIDKTGLGKVIDNIMDNAVKYSQNIHKVSIQLHERTLQIQDHGVGMDEVELIRIFDRYYQSNNSMRGFGIGLNMVKRFCDANSVVLNFRSKPDIGTTVTLKFKEIQWKKTS